jgi:hypothetical protein
VDGASGAASIARGIAPAQVQVSIAIKATIRPFLAREKLNGA